MIKKYYGCAINNDREALRVSVPWSAVRLLWVFIFQSNIKNRKKLRAWIVLRCEPGVLAFYRPGHVQWIICGLPKCVQPTCVTRGQTIWIATETVSLGRKLFCGNCLILVLHYSAVVCLFPLEYYTRRWHRLVSNIRYLFSSFGMVRPQMRGCRILFKTFFFYMRFGRTFCTHNYVCWLICTRIFRVDKTRNSALPVQSM